MGLRFYHWANAFMRVAFRLAVDLHIDGMSNVPRTGPLIVAINHSSFIDPLLVGSFVPRDVVMMSKSENFHLPMKRLKNPTSFQVFADTFQQWHLLRFARVHRTALL